MDAMADPRYTRCPGCATVFRVTAAQLELREGQVRCGHCRAVFDANDHFVSLDAGPAPDEFDATDELMTGRPTVTLRSADALHPVAAKRVDRPPPAAATPIAEPVVAEKPAAEPAAEPVAGQPIVEEPIVAEPAAEEPTAAEPAAEERAAEERAAEERAAEERIGDERTAEERAAEEPAARERVADEPATGSAAKTATGAEEFAAKEGVTGEAVARETGAEASAAEQPATEACAAEEPPTEPRATEPSAIEESATEESATEESATEESAAEEPPTEQRTTESSATEESATEEAAAESAEPREPADAVTPAEAVAAGALAPIDIAQADRLARFEWKKRRTDEPRRALYVVALVALVAGIALQAVFEYRDALAAHFPATRPLLASACRALACTIDPPRDAAALSIDASDLQADAAHRGLLMLSATIRNRAAHAIAYPYLELTLTDSSDRVVVRRAFAPAEYAGGTADTRQGIAANGERLVKLFLDASATQQAGYRLYLFYP
jgi:predicted Zn finger-like uncharacterized protein